MTTGLYRFERSARPLAGPADVGADAARAYARDGFLSVAGVLSTREVDDARAALCGLIEGDTGTGPDTLQPEPTLKDTWSALTGAARIDAVRKVWRFVERAPVLDTLVRHPAIQRTLETLLGEPCRLIQDMALLKPPRVGSEKPWHQDMAYFGWGPPDRIIGVWIALDAATGDNGCMHLLPGSHLRGPVAHAHVRDCQIPDAQVRSQDDVMAPLEPGGALFFHALLHHGTPPNDSESRRWALQFHYAGVSATQMDRREHARLFFDGDRYAGCRGETGAPIARLEP